MGADQVGALSLKVSDKSHWTGQRKGPRATVVKNSKARLTDGTCLCTFAPDQVLGAGSGSGGGRAAFKGGPCSTSSTALAPSWGAPARRVSPLSPGSPASPGGGPAGGRGGQPWGRGPASGEGQPQGRGGQPRGRGSAGGERASPGGEGASSAQAWDPNRKRCSDRVPRVGERGGRPGRGSRGDWQLLCSPGGTGRSQLVHVKNSGGAGLSLLPPSPSSSPPSSLLPAPPLRPPVQLRLQPLGEPLTFREQGQHLRAGAGTPTGRGARRPSPGPQDAR